jgi:uncharacterized protein YaiL (DUF2058 family)
LNRQDAKIAKVGKAKAKCIFATTRLSSPKADINQIHTDNSKV